MTLSFIRCLFLMMSAVVGYYVGTLIQEPLLGVQIGCLGGLLLIFIERQLSRVSVRGLSSMVFGLLLGVLLAKLISNIMRLIPNLGEFFLSVSEIILILVFSYIGAVMALRGKDEFNIIIPYVRFKRQDIGAGVILLDTSVIIDGRIYEIYKSNFLSGRLVIPRSVLKEIQTLADSENEIKRQRGRRGMDLLRNMQKDAKVEIRIHEDEPREGEDVDAKLVLLAKQMDGSICTTDFNLGRVASVQGVKILNINDLVNAVKSIVLTGEELDIRLVREGKEADQAVGFLEDGTMVVVGEARRLIGKQTKVKVTSILQTQAGRMIFAKLK